MEFLRFFLFGSVAFDARGQRSVCISAIDDAFRKVVRRVLEDGFLRSQSRQFEVRPGSPGFRMSNVIDFGAARLNPQVFEEDGLASGHSPAHTDQRSACDLCPVFVNLRAARSRFPIAADPGQILDLERLRRLVRLNGLDCWSEY